jgi:murein DD-endopeptidase MepM/ murein hydrolase activator NlpD
MAALLIGAAACVGEAPDNPDPLAEGNLDLAAPGVDGHYLRIGSASTWLKKTTAQSSTLALGSGKCALEPGTLLLVQSAPEVVGEHYRVNTRTFLPNCGFSLGYVYIAHVTETSGGGGGSGGALLRPVPGAVSSKYGPRGSGFHYGLDIAAPTGTPIKNPAGGTLHSQFYAGGCGNSFQVNHSGGLRTRYCHLSAFAGVSGRYYERGTTMGRVGNTGNSTGPHLHVETYVNDAIRDPLSVAPHWK